MRIWLLVPLQRDLFRRPWKAHWLSTTSYYFHRLRNRWPCTLIFGRTSVAYGFNTPYRLWHAAAGIELSSSRRRKRRVLARPELIFQFFLPRAGFELGTRQRNPKRDYEAAALPLCYLTTWQGSCTIKISILMHTIRLTSGCLGLCKGKVFKQKCDLMFIQAYRIHNWFEIGIICIRKTVTLIRSTNIKQAKGIWLLKECCLIKKVR